MKIKLLFFALMVGLGVKAQSVTIRYDGGGLTTKPQKVGKGDVTTNSCWANGDISQKTIMGVLSIAKSNGCAATAGYKASVNGKIAVINLQKIDANGVPLSGECSNAYRAKVAADSGAIAVVIVNNRTVREQFVFDSTYFKDVAKLSDAQIKANVDGYINFGAGAQAVQQANPSSCVSRPGNSVKIPVVQITKEDADLLLPKLIAGQEIKASIGFNSYDYDVSIDPNIALPLHRSRPESMVRAHMVHDTLGFVMYNKGLKTMKNVVANLTVSQLDANGVPTPIFKDSVFIDSIQQIGGKSYQDTLFVVPVVFKTKSDLKEGWYEVDWKLKTVNSKTESKETFIDLDMKNNTAKGYFQVTKSLLSAGSISASVPDIQKVNGKNDTIVYKDVPGYSTFMFQKGKLNDDFKICQVYENDHAKGLSLKSVNFWALRPAVKDSLLNSTFKASVWLWVPSINDMYNESYIKKDELNLLDSVSYTFKDFNGKIQKRIMGNATIQFKKAINMEDKAKYLVCVATKDSNVYFGIQKPAIKTTWSQAFNKRIVSPMYFNGDASGSTEFYEFGFGSSYINSLAVTVEGKSVSSLEENDVTTNLHVYPNPSSNGSFKFASSTGSLSVYVTDLNGKVVYNFENKNHNALTHTIELEDIATGMYVARIVNNDEMSIVKLQVSK